MLTQVTKQGRRVGVLWERGRCWLFLRRRVTGRLKLRGDLRRLQIDPSFRCDGDLWLGIHSDEGSISIEVGVSASGPLVITAVRPIRIGARTLFGPNVLVTDHYHGNAHDVGHRALPPSSRPLHSPGKIEIEEDVQLGANAVVLAPSTIGRGAIVAANAVVKGNVPQSAIHIGLASAPMRRESRHTEKTGE